MLAYDDSRLQESVTRLLQLLPAAHPTQLLLDTAADLDLPPELLALQYQELGMAFQASLGSQITAKPLHHLLQRMRLLGPELAHAALQETPQLLDAPLDRAQANLRWLQRQLGLSPVAAMLLAGSCGQLLLLPQEQLAANYASLRYLLQQLLGWRQQQLHSMLCNVPQLLVAQPQQCAGAWQRVQRLARRRLAWLRELSAAEAPLVTSVLGAQRMQLAMLQYAADTGDLGSRGLGQVLQMPYVDFVSLCPGFRTWRAMAPGRWRFEAAAAGSVGRSGTGDGGSEGAAAGEAPAATVAQVGEPGAQGAGVKSTDAAGGSGLRRRVLAEDASGRPVLVAVGGPLGRFDRLA
ncbi:hypothetical protein COO60DRAFT_1704328 [Scenedesmus sp. NREL 46B-D3]|nr:hypothetical protein COO60DRAFT_1704328 [Scenedesmus sp. NREL 46B-D3]